VVFTVDEKSPVIVNGKNDIFNLVKNKLFHCYSAIWHDLLHFLSSQVEIFVEVIHNLLYHDPLYHIQYVAFFIGKGNSSPAFSTSENL